MFKKILLIGLLCIGLVALLGTQATAGCIPLSGGGQYCAWWITGSTDLQVHAKGLGKLDCFKTSLPCPGFSAAIYGTIQDPAPNAETCGDEGLFDPDCLISVRIVCGPKKCDKNPNLPGCQNMDYNSSHFQFDDIGIKYEEFEECKKNGTCKDLVGVLTNELAEEICSPGHVVISAYAEVFNGESCFCEGGYDTSGDCNGTEECLQDFCQIDANPEPGAPYTCDPIPQD